MKKKDCKLVSPTGSSPSAALLVLALPDSHHVGQEAESHAKVQMIGMIKNKVNA